MHFIINIVPISCSELVLNFGASSPTGCPQELCLVVTNSSAVSTKLSASVQHFAAPHNSQTASFSIVNAGNSSYYNNRYEVVSLSFVCPCFLTIVIT